MSSLHFKKVSMRNFLSYGNATTEINLDQRTTIGVNGEDLDNTTDGKRSNGTGKTTILNAISYVLFDKVISDIATKDDIINNVNKKNMLVTIEFSKDGKNYTIERGRKVKGKGAAHVAIYDSSGKDIAPASNSDANEKIISIIGLPFEMFKRIVLFTATDIPFFSLPTRDSKNTASQMGFIEELFGLTLLSEKAKILAEERKETKRQIETQTQIIETQEAMVQAHEDRKASIKSKILSFEKDRENSIIDITAQLDSISGVNIEREKQKHDSLVALNKSLAQNKSDERMVDGKAAQTNRDLAKVEQQLTHLRDSKCPYCLQSMPNAAEKISELENKLPELEKERDQWHDAHTIIAADIEEITQQINEHQKDQTVSDLSSLLAIQAQQTSLEDNLQQLKDATNPYLEVLEEIEKESIEKVDYTEISELKELLDHQDFLYKLLTRKDSFVRKALLDKNIPFLNNRLTRHLLDIGLPHKVTFTHEMTAKIEYLGRELRFGNLSSGQGARLNLALSLAFRDVLQALHVTTNLCFFDEVLDVGLDSVGVQAAAKLLKKQGKDSGISIFVISHRDELDGFFEKTLTVQMEQGFSSIKERSST